MSDSGSFKQNILEIMIILNLNKCKKWDDKF